MSFKELPTIYLNDSPGGILNDSTAGGVALDASIAS